MIVNTTDLLIVSRCTSSTQTPLLNTRFTYTGVCRASPLKAEMPFQDPAWPQTPNFSSLLTCFPPCVPHLSKWCQMHSDVQANILGFIFHPFLSNTPQVSCPQTSVGPLSADIQPQPTNSAAPAPSSLIGTATSLLLTDLSAHTRLLQCWFYTQKPEQFCSWARSWHSQLQTPLLASITPRVKPRS